MARSIRVKIILINIISTNSQDEDKIKGGITDPTPAINVFELRLLGYRALLLLECTKISYKDIFYLIMKEITFTTSLIVPYYDTSVYGTIKA